MRTDQPISTTVLAMLTVGVVALVGCNDVNPVQCIDDPNCNLRSGGVCSVAATGNKWCAYPDPECPGGLRYSNGEGDTGDGLKGVCVAATPLDAAVDAGSANCASLPNTCGIGNSDSCCNSPEVMGGNYFRSYDVAGSIGSGDMKAPAVVSSFRLDKYEITVGRFRSFVGDGKGTQAKPPVTGTGTHGKLPGSGWDSGWNLSLVPDTASLVAALKCDAKYQTWTDAPSTNENRPINCITWYEAMAFCAWDGGYLPTETEWNYAAAGGDQQRAYPWSDPASSIAIDTSQASYGCIGDGVDGCSLTDLVPVGTKQGAGRWGQQDLGGNVTEWTLDTGGLYATPCTDCASLTPAQDRMARGGDFEYGSNRLRTGYRDYFTPSLRNASIGARCARP